MVFLMAKVCPSHMSLLCLTTDNVQMPKGKLEHFVTIYHKPETRPAVVVAP